MASEAWAVLTAVIKAIDTLDKDGCQFMRPASEKMSISLIKSRVQHTVG